MLALLPVAVFAVWVAVLVWLIGSLAQTAERVDHTDQVISEISRLESQVYAEIVAVRGFLIGGSDRFLRDYQSPDQIERAVSALHGLIRDNAAQQERLTAYRDTWRAWRKAADAEIAARRSGGDIAPTLADEVDPLEQRMRQVAATLRAEEERLRVARVARASMMRRQTLVATTVMGLVLATLLSFFSVRTLRQVASGYERTDAGLRSEAVKLAETERQLRVVVSREQDARRLAEDANRAKDDFLATVSHELRTPLHAIIGWQQVLKNEYQVTTPLVGRAFDAMERNTALLTRVVEDLMDNARILSRKLTLAPQPTNIADAVRGAIQGVAVPAAQKGIAVGVEVEPALPTVVGDPVRLQQVFWNLLANAVKFTPQNGRVDVAIRSDAGQVVVTIADTGRGISREFLPHVFERFTQEDSRTTRDFPGLGLGLALVQHLVEAHDGSVVAASDGPGTGATFVVRLPAASEATERRLPV